MLSISRSTLQSFCRVCLRQLPLNLPSIKEPSHDINKDKFDILLQSISGVKIKSDEFDYSEYPQLVCHDCYVKTRVLLAFREKAILGTGVLKLLVSEKLKKAAIIKLKSFCRICRKERNNSSEIYYSTEKGGETYNFMYECTGLLLSEDAEDIDDTLREDNRFPSHLCGGCHSALKNFAEFRMAARQTDEYVKSLLAGEDASQNDAALEKQHIPFINSETNYYEGCETNAALPYQMPIKVEMKILDSEVQIDKGETKGENNSYNDETNFDNTNTRRLRSSKANGDSNQNTEYNDSPADGVDDMIMNENTYDRFNMAPAQSNSMGSLFKCILCEKRFYKEYLLHAHIRGAHEGVERPFECAHCPKSFRVVLLLSRHVRAKHPGSIGMDGKRKEKIFYDCPHCKRQYTRKDHLKEHILAMHDEKRPFACKECGKTFGSKNVLFRHEQNHAGIRPFICEHCGKTFNSVSRLKHHIQRHHSDPDLLCPICKRGQANSEELQKHIEMHEISRQHNCAQCGKVFTKVAHAREHELTVHQKMRPYKCKQCDKAFAARKSLRLHEKTHDPTGRTEHCTECQLYFKTKRQLRLHMSKTHAQKEPEINYHSPFPFNWN